MPASDDSIDFFARYKDWTSARSLAISNSTSKKEAAAFIVAVREEVSDKAFSVLGIDTKSLDSYAQKLAKLGSKGDYSSLISIYKSLGSSDVEGQAAAASQNKVELLPFAKAYLFRSALRQLGIKWYLGSDDKAFSSIKLPKQITPSFSSQGVMFMAKYGEWISVKKLSIDEKTMPEEVAAQLSSIRLATDRKATQVLGVNTEDLDVYVMGLTQNMRKSAANLEKIIAALNSPEAKKAIDDSCMGDSSLKEAAKTYMFGKMLQSVKIDLEVSPDTLMDMFPNLKIPKPKGRMPGQKKKKA